MAELSIKNSEIENGVKLDIDGRITTTTADNFEKTLDDAHAEGNKVIILNMSKVTIMASVGIRIMLKTLKDARKTGGKLLIEEPSDVVRNVLGLSNLAQMLVGD